MAALALVALPAKQMTWGIARGWSGVTLEQDAALLEGHDVPVNGERPPGDVADGVGEGWVVDRESGGRVAGIGLGPRADPDEGDPGAVPEGDDVADLGLGPAVARRVWRRPGPGR